jgi:S1-C subfamily serine protease
MNRLRNRVAAIKPGEKVRFEIFRDGERTAVSVEIGELESQTFLARGGAEPDDLGMRVQNITPELARRMRIQNEEQGIVVTSVTPGGMAENAGLRAGDLIIAVGDDSVASLADFRAAIAGRDLDKGVRLQVRSDGTQRYAFLKR